MFFCKEFLLVNGSNFNRKWLGAYGSTANDNILVVCSTDNIKVWFCCLKVGQHSDAIHTP